MSTPIGLRPELSLPTGERLKTLWLIGMALAEGAKHSPQRASEMATEVAEQRELIVPTS